MRHFKILLFAAGFNFLIYNGGRLLACQKEHYYLTTALDRQIPFLPVMILIYWGCYLFWSVNYFIGVKYDKGNGSHFIGAHFIGETICFFIFVLFPTTMVRPGNLGNTIFEKLINLTYQVDAADNLFPSIHCFVSWLCWIAVRNNKNIPKWYQVLSLIMAVSVCMSTLTVKQHVIVDVLAGVLLAELSYIISGEMDKSKRHDYRV